MIHPILNFRPRAHVLNESQVKEIHLATLEMLERTGVKVTHARALELLHGAGARVDRDRVRIPAWIVEDSIRKAPSRVVLGHRNGKRSVFLEGDKNWFGPCLDTLDYLDPLTNARRPFTSDDCRVTATIADALPNYSWVMTLGLAADCPADVGDRVIAKQVIIHCDKPLVFCCKDLNSLRDIYEMALMIAGEEKRFQQAPTIANISSPISPLVHSDTDVDKLLFSAEKCIPHVGCSLPQLGATAPATFAGTVVVGNAEGLSSLVLSQLARPGVPFIFGAFLSVMDMSTSVLSYGAPEMSLMVASLAQMAQVYNLPFFGTAGCSDAKYPDPQAAAEAAFSCLSSALSGANLIHDSGVLDHGSMASPGFMVLVNEVLHMVGHYMRGISVSDEMLALDLVDSLGPGRTFLAEEHTLKHFRDVWHPELFDRMTNSKWLERGAKSFEERLREQTQKLMAHKSEPLPSEVEKELHAMAARWK